jgi:hypothetical protein
MSMFNELIDLANTFVELHEEGWDNDSWLEFLLQLQKKGFKVNAEFKDYLGSVLEALQAYHHALTTSTRVDDTIREVSEITIEFIKKTKARWDYNECEEFFRKLSARGFKMNNEVIFYLNGLLDAIKKIYSYSLW